MSQLIYLNFDVLSMIFECLGKHIDMSSMMKTCRILHEAGIPSLLRDITISTMAQLNSALACLLSPGHQERCSYLRHLTLWFYTPIVVIQGRQPEKIRLLSDVVNRATRLKSFEVAGPYVDIFLMPGSPMFRSLCFHPTLESLMITHATNEAGDLVSNMRAPISKLHLAFLGTQRLDPLSFLQPISSTLRTLALEGVEFRDQGPQLPNVRSLLIRVDGCPNLEPLISVLPNLRELFLVPIDSEYYWDNGELEGCRAKNQAILKRMSNSWTYLDCLSGTVLSIFAMNLPCRVRYLELLFAEAESPDVVYMVLDALQPSVLKLNVTTEFAQLEDIEMFLSLVLNHIGNVTRLDLEIDLSASRVDGSRIMDIIASAFSTGALPVVNLILRVRNMMKFSSPENEEPAPSPGPTRDFLDRFASEPFAHQLAQSMPNLRYLLLDLSNATVRRADPMEYWSVERTNTDGISVTTRGIGRKEGELVLNEGFTVWDPSFFRFKGPTW